VKDETTNLTQVLLDTSDERPARVAEKLMPIVYERLHAMAEKYLRSERVGHTLQPTALVHEAYMRLVDQSRVDWRGKTHFVHEAYMRLVDQSRVDWRGKTHFCAVGAAAMRRILIDHARARGRGKRGGGWQRIVLDDAVAAESFRDLDIVALHEALEKLAKLDPEQAQIVELRFFGGLTVEEVAHILGVSKRKVEGDWTHAKAWLRNELEPDAA
jgi:RNA polymerase sigma factor (TIGR02999 family)